MHLTFSKIVLLALSFLVSACGTDSETKRDSESKFVIAVVRGPAFPPLSPTGTDVFWMTNFSSHGFLGGDRYQYGCFYNLHSETTDIHHALQQLEGENGENPNPLESLRTFLAYDDGRTKTELVRSRPLKFSGVSRSFEPSNAAEAMVRRLQLNNYTIFGVFAAREGTSLWLSKVTRHIQANKETLKSAPLIEKGAWQARQLGISGLQALLYSWIFFSALGGDAENPQTITQRFVHDSSDANSYVWRNLQGAAAINLMRKAIDRTPQIWEHNNPDVYCLAPEMLAQMIKSGTFNPSENPHPLH